MATKAAGRQLRVLALFDAIAPTKLDQDLRRELKTEDWSSEADVLRALKRLGHTADYVAVFDDLDLLRQKIAQFKPDIVFNLADQFRNDRVFDQHIAAYLELIGIPYTGCGPLGLALAKDKALSKKILAHHGLRVPAFATIPRRARIRRPRRLKLPLVVKPLNEEASLGITDASLVYTDHQFEKQVRLLREKYGLDVIAEEYIHGRELYVSILGDRSVRVFPIREIIFDLVEPDHPRIAGYRAKWDYEYRWRWGIDNQFARLRPAMKKKIQQFGREAFHALKLSGYARLDLRLTGAGDIVFLEANPNPILASFEDFAQAARKDGLKYHELIQAILRLGLRARRG